MDIGKEFLDVAAEYDKTRGLTDDINGLFETNKYGVSPLFTPNPRVSTNPWLPRSVGRSKPSHIANSVAFTDTRAD